MLHGYSLDHRMMKGCMEPVLAQPALSQKEVIAVNESNRRNLWAFFLLTFGYSWTLWVPFMLAGIGVIQPSATLTALVQPAVMLGAFAPLLAAVTLIARHTGWSGVKRHLRRTFDLRTKAIYLVLAVLLPLVITAGTHYIVNGTGIDSLPRTLFPENWGVPPLLLAVPCFVAMLLVGGGQEEFGWRGYAQEPLQQRYGVVWGSIVLGLIWGVWHLPLWIMPGDGHAYYSFWAFLLQTTSISLIMAWLWNASGKKEVTTWVMHAALNTAMPLFPVLREGNVPQPGYWLWAGLNALVALSLAIWFLRKHADSHAGEERAA